MIPVVMEPRMRRVGEWGGVLEATLGGILYVDLSEDREDLFQQGCEKIASSIRNIMTKDEEESGLGSQQPSSSPTKTPIIPLSEEDVTSARGNSQQ